MPDQSEKLERMSTGIAGLDLILDGGLFRGGMYLVQGTPGTGKTTLANQICFHGIRSDHRALYVTLLAEYHSRMVQYIGRMSFFDETMLPDQLTYISGFQTLRSEGLNGLLTLIRREVLAKKPGILIVDGLLAAQRSAANERAFNEFIHELQGVAIGTNCTVCLIASSDRNNYATPEHTMVDGILELSDTTIGWTSERTLKIAKIRGSKYLRGKHSYKITDDGIEVHPRIEELARRPDGSAQPTPQRLPSGVDALDVLLQGGLPDGSTTVLIGPSGIGKTTFGLYFLSRCSPATPGLMFSFYETPPRIIVKARQVCRPVAELIHGESVELLWQTAAADSLDAHADRLLKAVRRRGVRRLFLDGLNALQSAPDSDKRIPSFLTALTSELRALGVTTICSLEAGDMLGSSTPVAEGGLSSIAENVILLRYVERGSSLHRLISISKVRDSNFDQRLHEFALSEEGPQISASTDSAAALMAESPIHDSASAIRPA